MENNYRDRRRARLQSQLNGSQLLQLVLIFYFLQKHLQNSQKTKSHFNKIDILETPKRHVFRKFSEISRPGVGLTYKDSLAT